MRTRESHNYHCGLIGGALSTYDSTTYGVNKVSPLNSLDHFHVVGGQLPQDVMHVLYEGVLPLEVKLLLYQLVFEEHIFTLESLNERFSSFLYGRHEVKNDLPKRIEQQHLRGISKLPLSGIRLFTCMHVSTLIVNY